MNKNDLDEYAFREELIAICNDLSTDKDKELFLIKGMKVEDVTLSILSKLSRRQKKFWPGPNRLTTSDLRSFLAMYATISGIQDYISISIPEL